jgi:hypothetical protein
MNTATAIQLQPFLTDILQLVVGVLLVIGAPLANRLLDQAASHWNLKANATAHSVIDGVVESAIAYAATNAKAALTRVGPIETSNPTLAAAANFVIAHAPEELAQLGFTEQHVIELVRANLLQTPTPQEIKT